MPLWVSLSAGIEDAFNPCALLTCAVFLLLRLWAERKGLDINRCMVVFISTVFGLSFIFSLGFFADFLSAHVSTQLLVVTNLILALFVACLGAIFIYDWVLLCRGAQIENLFSTRLFLPKQPSSPHVLLGAVVVIAAGAMMSFLSTAWPPNFAIGIESSNLYLPGKFIATAVMLAMYTFIQLWLLMALAVLLSWKKLTPRMRLMIHAAIFCSAAGVVIYVF